MKSNELRDLSLQELEMKEQEVSKDLFNLKMRHSLNHLDNPLTIREAKRTLARVKTLLAEHRQEELQGSEGME